MPRFTYTFTFTFAFTSPGVVDHFNQIGYDVMEMMMPLIGCNQAYQYGNPRSHQWFQQCIPPPPPPPQC